jgi:hypothetical protein
MKNPNDALIALRRLCDEAAMIGKPPDRCHTDNSKLPGGTG